MNPISNIWNYPKTSFAGLLIAVVTVAGVFSQQGVTLETAGTGTMVSLVAAVAAALLGLVARDPGEPQHRPEGKSADTVTRLSAWMLIVLLLPLPWIEGCWESASRRTL